ncbi:response regulator transcription factor [Hominenteromicrobium sp.]|uniref:response regulator transcription factor n=1 Tax=Hominenteromicrobium sp. TaxID=3073581 RepID=UPI003AB8A7C9
MYRILVVDDEKLVRQDIVYKVGKSGFSFEWIMEASCTEEALEIIKVSHPDIMLTDIMMWERSGLELIEEANRLAPKMISAVICGYPDFSFAQRALKLGVYDYLLKPVTPDQVTSLLTKMIAAANEKQNAGVLVKDNYVLSKDLEYRRFQAQMTALLSGAKDFDRTEILSKFPADTKSYCIHILRIAGMYGADPCSMDSLKFGIRNAAQEIGEPYLIAVNGTHESEVVFILGCRETAEIARQKITLLAKKIGMLVSGALEIRVDSGLSAVTDTVDSGMYQAARYALDFRFSAPDAGARGKQSVVYSIASSPEEQLQNNARESDMTLYKRFLDSGDIKNTLDAVHRLFEQYRKNFIPGIRDSYVMIIATLSRSCYRKGIGILPFLGYENISGSVLGDFETLEDILKSLDKIISMAMGSWVHDMEDTADVLKHVSVFIDENFADSELSTNSLAQRFCISLGYLSASYKKTYGITISKYIIAKRMEYATKLLRETQISIQNIADSSGFNSLSYFMRLFKLYYNVTPARYRETEKTGS